MPNAVDNVMFVQVAQTLLRSLGSEEKNRVLHPECYLEPVAHVIYDFTDGREPGELRVLAPSMMQ